MQKWKVLSALLACFTGLLHGAVVIEGIGPTSPKQIIIPAEYAGMSANFYGKVNPIMDINLPEALTKTYSWAFCVLTSPSGSSLQTVKAPYYNGYAEMDYKATSLVTGTYKMRSAYGFVNDYRYAPSSYESTDLGDFTYSYAVVWEASENTGGSGSGSSESLVSLGDFIAAQTIQIESLRSELKGDLNTKTAELNQRISELQTQLAQLLTKHNDDQAAILARIADYENQLTNLAAQLRSEIAAVENEHADYLAKLENLRSTHDADKLLLTTQINNLNAKYQQEVDRINAQITVWEAELSALDSKFLTADQELKEKINALTIQQARLEEQLAAANAEHERSIAQIRSEIQAKTDAIATAHDADIQRLNTEIADLNQELVSLDNKFRDIISGLKSQLENADAALKAEIDQLVAADRDIYDKISDLREKQADYYARLETVKLTHQHDVEELERQIRELETAFNEKASVLQSSIQELEQKIKNLNDTHAQDVAAIQSSIQQEIGKLDSEIRKIYEELSENKSTLEKHIQDTTARFDMLEQAMTALDKSITERLQNLENRIKYSTYSDEKLESLKKDFEKQIQEKETEIANIDLEIQDLTGKGLDTSAKEATRERILTELTKLRNELTDIEFAIEIRNNESEFAEHEKEIALLKSEIATLRDSHTLEIKQLKESMIALENKYLQILEEVKQSAAGENAELKKQLDDLTSKVLAFVDALRSERETGDAELKALLDAMDVSHKELITNLDSSIADKLDKLKFESDTQFENLRSTINNIAYQQRFNTGSAAQSYTLPSSQVQEMPTDNRDLRVSPDASLNSILN